MPAARQAVAADVSVDLFYNNLSGGNWIEVGDYGYGWQPDVAVSDPNWRPYSDGYWAYTDVGWTWVSYEDFGWATYHYGRWSRLADYGWVWFPGNDLEWGPAWVSWRTGGDYIGWAPLPPRGPGIAAGVGFAGISFGGQVDVEFDIGPAYYNFVDVRYIGEPVLRDRIFASSQNVTYINQTVNVTNITTTNNTVYNYGPDYNTMSARSSRPIQRLSLERQENADLSTAAKSGALTKVQGDKLVIAAPTKLQKSAKPIAPPTVKAKVAQPKIDKGWTGVDPNAQAQIKQKIKTENPKNIPPPTGAAGQPATAASPMTSAAPATSASPFERGKQKGKPGQGLQPGGTASPGLAPATAPASPSPAAHGKEHKGKPGEQIQQGVTGTPSGSPGVAASPAMTPEHGKPGKGKRGEQMGATPPVTGPTGPTAGPEGVASPVATPEYGKPGKGKRGEQLRTTPPVTGPTAGSEGVATPPQGKHKGEFERPVPSQAPAQPGGVSNQPPPGKHKGPPATTETPYSAGGPGGAPEAQGGKHKGPPAGAQPAASAAERGPGGPGGPGPGKPAGGKKKGEASPSPTP